MSNESRVLDVLGPNLVIESNGPVGVAGPLAYQLYSVTDKGAKWQQALHGSGLSSMEASHTLEIQTGSKNKQGQISYMAMAHNGDMCMTTENGWIRIHGQNIVLDASNEILLQGAKVTLGNANGTTEQTEILGEKIIVNAGQEIRVVNSKRITRESGNIFLKSRKGNLAFYGGIAQAAFLPGVKAARTRPKEYTGGF